MFDRLLLANATLAVAVVVGVIVPEGQWKQIMVVQASGSTLLFLAAGLNAARQRLREVRFFVLGWACAIVSAALVSARHVVGIKLSSAAALDSMRIVAVCDALMMGLALIDRHLQMRALQAKTLEVSLANAQQNLVLHERSAAWRNVTSWPLIWPMRAAAR